MMDLSFPSAGAKKQQQNFTGHYSESPGDAIELHRSKLLGFARELSIVGSRHVFDDSRHFFRRIIWVLLVLFGLGLALYQIQDRIFYYKSLPTASNVNIVQATSMRFPQVTFCNENFYSRSVAQQYGLADALQQLYSAIPIPNATTIDYSVFTAVNRSQEEWDEISYRLLQRMDEAIVSVVWEHVPLNVSEVIIPVATDMGGCFAFNTAKFNFTVTQPGSQCGLDLILNVNQSDYLGANVPAAAFRILLHDPDETPLMYELGFEAGPGLYNSVAITIEKSSQLPSPYSTCIDTPGYYYNKCFSQCLSKLIIQKCQCKLLYMEADIRLCTPLETVSCVRQEAYGLSQLINPCSQCLPQCSATRYINSLSSAVRSDLYMTNVEQAFGIAFDDQQLNYVTIKLYFSSLMYNDISVLAAYSFMALLSDIGGALGLILGSTLLTFIELGEFMCESTWTTIQLRNKVGVMNPQQKPIGGAQKMHGEQKNKLELEDYESESAIFEKNYIY